MDKNLNYLLGQYKERMEYMSAALSQGNIPTIEEYRYVCGQLRGLEAACAIIVDLQKRMEHSDD